MYSDKVRKKTVLIVSLLILIALAAGCAYWAFQAGKANLKEEGAVAIQEAVLKSARQCYVVEGVYPSELSYLEDNYGLRVNTKDYYVTYDAFAENLPPTVRVTARY